MERWFGVTVIHVTCMYIINVNIYVQMLHATSPGVYDYDVFVSYVWVYVWCWVEWVEWVFVGAV